MPIQIFGYFWRPILINFKSKPSIKMRNYLLLLSLLATGVVVSAQQLSHRDSKPVTRLVERPVVLTNNQSPANHSHTTTNSNQSTNSSRALTSILNSQRIGSAGNLLTIIEGTCNQLDVNDSLNLVTFIHRCDPNAIPGSDVPSGSSIAKYAYDVSKNRGNSWTSDIGAITNNGSIDNQTICGRFPQAVIFNQAGNTIADSAHLIYSGTWHDNNTWCGQMRGRGKIGGTGNVATYNVNIDPINNKEVGIASSMCKGATGVFWNVNSAYTGTFTAGDAITTAILVQKGVWNPTTKNVDWSVVSIPQAFASFDNAGSEISAATSLNIAFDPTGQNGWIAIIGDITVDADSTYDPIFWKTTDGGANWTGPISVDLDEVQGVLTSLSPVLINGEPASLNPTTAFESDLTVDVNGNPHFLTTIGSGNAYSIEAAGYGVWDITYDASAITGCNWKGIHLADINTLRGTFSSDNPAQTMDNRPLVSRSEDGNKIFFFWTESDAAFLGTNDNSVPNLFGRAIDVVQEKITPLYNITEGDSLWGGETSNTESGVFGGAIFPTVSPVALKNGNNYNIPLVLTQVDYINFSQGSLGSSEQPAAFYYINNVNVPSADFTAPLDQVAPSITLNGSDTVTILLNNTYTEAGATAFDCSVGAITPTIVNSPDTSVVGTYNVLYIATDASGNSDTVVRTVIVGATPVADFTWSFPVNACKPQFQDLSANIPTTWVWSFGPGQGGSSVKNPTKTYTADGTYNVCLTATNSFGTSTQTCKQVTVTGCTTGINDLDFSSQVSLFPNPSNGKVAVTVNGDVSHDLTVSVYNVLGATVVNPTTYKAGTTNIQLDLSNVASGVYLVKVQNDNGSTVKHLTISHK